MIQWKCEPPNTEGLTVGQKFNLKCSGDPISLNKETLKLQTADKDPQLTLNLLGVNSLTGNSIEMTVTSYKVGEHKSESLILTDSTQSLELTNFNWKVQSVINTQENPKPTPYEAYGPWEMSIAWYYWLGFFGIIVFISLSVWIYLRLRIKRQKLIEMLRRMRTARPAFEEFHKELRLAERHRRATKLSNKENLAEIESIYRTFLVRELLVPALDKKAKIVLREIKRMDKKLSALYSQEILRCFIELTKAQSSQSHIPDLDRDQIEQLCRKSVENIWLYNKSKEKSS